jgi:glycosyltransferase involved in cell wall biosynthesis
MNQYEKYDLTYVTIDSLSEGVGSSQITPLVTRLSEAGLKINLISYEKVRPSNQIVDQLNSHNVTWNIMEFNRNGVLGGIQRMNELRRKIHKSYVIHARSEVATVSAIFSNQAPVLWDVRSLWADQKIMLQEGLFGNALYRQYRSLETISAKGSQGMSTLTHAVVPVLEQRHKKLPSMRIVVPTSVDLRLFAFSPIMPSSIRALFSGTYNNYYDMNLSALFMQELRKQISIEIHWARPIESDITAINVGEEQIFPASRNVMAELIQNYSFGVSICKIDAGPSLSAAMPTKMAEFLACGRPIVVNQGLGDMDRFIQEFNAGVILDGETSSLSESATQLIDLIKDPETPLRCRALAEKYFNIDVGAIKYLDLYTKMINNTE